MGLSAGPGPPGPGLSAGPGPTQPPSKLTAVRSVASFSTEGLRVSTAFRPSWKKLEQKSKRACSLLTADL